jgi:hypothetical protein
MGIDNLDELLAAKKSIDNSKEEIRNYLLKFLRNKNLLLTDRLNLFLRNFCFLRIKDLF